MRILLIVACFSFIRCSAQEILKVPEGFQPIANYFTSGETANGKGLFLATHQTLITKIEDTENLKCMVLIGNMVNVIGIWELNDLNDIAVYLYEIELVPGRKDLLLAVVSDKKSIQLSLYQLQGEELVELGTNYLEQKVAGQTMEMMLLPNGLKLKYDKGSEHPVYGIINGVFQEIEANN